MFRLGRASNLDIIDAQEALFKAQNQYVSKLVDYHIQLALLESLTGQPLSQ
jgi:outer membrane protein TolC